MVQSGFKGRLRQKASVSCQRVAWTSWPDFFLHALNESIDQIWRGGVPPFPYLRTQAEPLTMRPEANRVGDLIRTISWRAAIQKLLSTEFAEDLNVPLQEGRVDGAILFIHRRHLNSCKHLDQEKVIEIDDTVVYLNLDVDWKTSTKVAGRQRAFKSMAASNVLEASKPSAG